MAAAVCDDRLAAVTSGVWRPRPDPNLYFGYVPRSLTLFTGGGEARSRLRTPEGLCADGFDRLRRGEGGRVAVGEVAAGFQTPSCAFGPDYILSFDGAMRDDLNS